MDGEASAPGTAADEIFIAAVSDDALERAGTAAAAPCITLIYCTQDLSCGDAYRT